MIPVGLVFRRKDVFRSEALVLRSQPVEWRDLAARGVEDAEAVRRLTDRIDQGLRQVTVTSKAGRTGRSWNARSACGKPNVAPRTNPASG